MKAAMRHTAAVLTTAIAILVTPVVAFGQTNPAAQTLPYTQSFSGLAYATSQIAGAWTDPALAGWQGWQVSALPSGAYSTAGPAGDRVLTASATAATNTNGGLNYNGKIGVLNSAANDNCLALAINTTGLSGVAVAYEIATLRNPHGDATPSNRITGISLQYRVGTGGAWSTLAATEYTNNTTQQVTGVVPQNIQYRSATLPAACDNQAVVQLRWAQREISGTGNRPSFAIDNVSVQQPVAGSLATALRFDGVNDHVTFGQASSLSAANFTVETWFMRTGAGVVTTTGSGTNAQNGLTNVVPLVSKGRGEGDGALIDCNYFLGIQNTPNVVLVADYEHDATSNNNHALVGATPLANSVWYHAAVTYDGSTLRLYLNGVLDAQVGATPAPRSDLIQHAGLGVAMTSTGAVQGAFQGDLDEARFWNVARSACDIATSMNSELTSGTGLVARWGMHDGSGLVLSNSLATPNGILINGPAWVAGSPFNAPPPPPPADPTGLTANAPDGVQIQLAWTDVATGESGYEVERSTSGPGGPFSPLATLAANANSYTDGPVDAGSQYCYRVRAVSGCGNSNYAVAACATPVALCNALLFDPDGAGTDSYANFGNAANLKLTALTIEMWMRRDGPGVGTNTGTGGIPDIIPFVSKGRADAETPTQDINYIFGIRASDGVLAADFEEGPAGASPSQNHPVAGTTVITTGTWRHVAATYDGSTWQLYIDGQPEASLAVGQPLCSASNAPTALASALTLAGAPSGYFDGAVDEVRIWNYARIQTQIQSDMNNQISAPATGLVGRWALDEGTGTIAYGTAGTGIHGTIVGSAGTNWSRTACAPFNAVPVELSKFTID